MGRFERGTDGALLVRLHPDEVDVLRTLAGELGALLEHPVEGDAAIDRLFPRAYLDPTEEEAEGEWQRLVHTDLVEQRLRALSILVATLPDTPTGSDRLVEASLDEEQEAAWLGVLNDARLAMGTRLGVTDDYDVDDVPRDDPQFVVWSAYTWLTAIQSDLVRVLLGGLPETGIE
jgi:hypothetical protein